MGHSRKEITSSIRKLIIFHHSSGKSIQNIAKLANLYHSTVVWVPSQIFTISKLINNIKLMYKKKHTVGVDTAVGVGSVGEGGTWSSDMADRVASIKCELVNGIFLKNIYW